MRGRTDRAPRIGAVRAVGTKGGAAAAPVLRLLRRDLAALRPGHAALIGLIYVMAALQAVRHDEALFGVGVLLAVAVALAVPAIEWRLDIDRTVASLPVRRSTLVRARYAAAGLAVALGWSAWFATGTLVAPYLAADRSGPDSWATAAGHLAFLSVSVTVLAAFLPLFFRLGLGRAATVFAPVGAALYALLWLAAAALPGATGLRSPGALARSLVAASAGAWGWPVASALVLLTLVAIGALSLGLSVRGFRRRDL